MCVRGRVCVLGVKLIVLCFRFVCLRLVYHMLPVSLDCPLGVLYVFDYPLGILYVFDCPLGILYVYDCPPRYSLRL
jgi:hypothetical protein